jgi:hypothetical protein
LVCVAAEKIMALVLRPPGSRESLTDDLAYLGRMRKRVAIAAGLFALLAVVIGCITLAGILDAAFHLPPLARALALTISLALSGVVWFRGVTRALILRTDSLSIALELEEKYPALNDALASAVSFLDGPEPEARGISNRLQAAAVRSARRLADRYEFRRMVPSGACWRAAWAFGLAVAVAVPLVLVNRDRAATALVRLADPFGVHPWPTKTRIEILAPTNLSIRIPKGEPFELKFVVRGLIKDRATVTFRLHAGDEFEEQYPLVVGNDPNSFSAAVVSTKIDPNRLPNSFTFRIVSNDADTDWQKVEVVPPPRLIPIDGRASPRFWVVPPAYTGLPSRELPEGEVLAFPAGSAVSMRAATDVRLSAATLSFIGDRSSIERAAPLAALGHLNPLAAASSIPLAEGIGSDIPLFLDATGRVLSASFSPSMSGPYALKLTDETGLTGTRVIDIRLAPDPTPIVTLLHPAIGKDPAIFTPEANLPVHVAADDKVYSVRRTFLEYRVGKDGSYRTIELSDARNTTLAIVAIGGGFLATTPVRPISTEARLAIPVAQFKRDDGAPVRAGDSLFIRGAADDWDDVSPAKEPGRSEGEVEIAIASTDAIEAWLQRELAAMRPDLIRLRDQQREARSRTLGVSPLADGTLTPADRDRLLGIEHQQDQILGKIGDPRDGLWAKAETFRDTIRVNNLLRSNTTDRVARVADELGRLKERDLPVIKPSLAEARTTGAQPARTGQEQVVPDLLKRAGRHQKAVEEGLTNLLDLLAVWGGASEIRGEARVLRDLLNRLATDTDNLAERVHPGKAASSLTPAQQAELDRAGARAEQAAEQIGSLFARAARIAEQKERSSATILGIAAATDILAGMMGSAAHATPAGDPRKSALNARANALRLDADDLKSAALKASDEAAALRKGINDAGGTTLSSEQRQAADGIRNNRQAESAAIEHAGAARLERLADALAEKEPAAAPDLKKWQKTANQLNALADAEDDLRKRALEAAKLTDPIRREAELRRLALEQGRLIERGKEVLQRLTREGAGAAARDARAALDRMETSRDELEKGNSGTRAQSEAVDRLDTARDRLDAAAANPGQQLSDEKRRKMADKVKGLLERQKSAVAEAERIHKLVAADKMWKRPVERSYVELGQVETNLAEEIAKLEADFAQLPVLARVLAEASNAMKSANEKITMRLQDTDPALAFDPDLETANDRRVIRPMALAARRLEQLLEALKQDDPKSKNEPGTKGPPKTGGQSPPTSGGGSVPDIVPPLAQLKVLRALQAELNQQTAEFATTHVDPAKLTEEERDELKDLEKAQREIATLFEQLAKLFDDHKLPKPDKPESGKPEKMP